MNWFIELIIMLLILLKFVKYMCDTMVYWKSVIWNVKFCFKMKFCVCKCNKMYKSFSIQIFLFKYKRFSNSYTVFYGKIIIFKFNNLPYYSLPCFAVFVSVYEFTNLNIRDFQTLILCFMAKYYI